MVAGALLLLTVAGAVLAAGPPFPDRPTGAHVIDDAEVFNRAPEDGVEEGLRAFLDSTGVDIVVLTQVKAAARDQAAADDDARALLEQWDVGGADGQGAVLLWDFDRRTTRAQVSLALGGGLASDVDADALRTQLDSAMAKSLEGDDWLNALNSGLFTITAAVPGGAIVTPVPSVAPAVPAAENATTKTPR